MRDDFLDGMFERFDSSPASMRIGTLTAIDAPDASLTVSLAGDEVAGVRWVGSYTPVVGDIVVVSRVETMWVVLGKLSKQFGAPTVEYDSFTQLLHEAWQWTSATGWAVASMGFVEQNGAGGAATHAGMFLHYQPGPPSGSTILSAHLTLTRGHPIYDGGAPLVAPVIYGTNAPLSVTPTGSPSLVPGYGPWSPGTLMHEETGIWELPSTWVTALLAGTLTGFVFYTTAAASEMTIDTAGLSGSLKFNYSIPV